MSYFENVIRPLISSATHINHYPQFCRFEFMENEKLLTKLYTTKSTQELAIKYKLPTNEITITKYNKIKNKLKIEVL
jgi:hypothetical protein